jgi:hypothetical protein
MISENLGPKHTVDSVKSTSVGALLATWILVGLSEMIFIMIDAEIGRLVEAHDGSLANHVHATQYCAMVALVQNPRVFE